MKLICNLSMLGKHPTGLGVYAEHCVSGLAQRFNLAFIAGNSAMPEGETIAAAPENIAIGGGKFAALRRQWWMRSLRFDSDLVYSPTHHGLPGQSGQIITIHDLICLRFPAQHWPQYLFFRFGLPRLLKKCRAVFTVSEATRQDIAKNYRYPSERIFIVPNGVDTDHFFPAPAERPKHPFLLMVGARYPHKNVDEVLSISSCWKERYRLIVTSCGGQYRQRLEQKVRDLGLSDRVEFKDYLSSAELLKLYQGASALLYPSLWEGFGIPPLEALACGTPVIASDIPALREVLAHAAIFVKPGSVESWRSALQTLADPASLAGHLSSGYAQLQKFTWNNAVDALEQALLRVEPRLETLRK
jgi:glycosyltransferase involved in cell wall biosynthesis